METNQENGCFIVEKRHPQGYEISTYDRCMVCTEGGWSDGSEKWWRRWRKA